MNAPKAITYPARPVNGGPFPMAPAKSGTWWYEEKFNGWRTLVHVPTGTMYNRHDERLSIEHEFAEALAVLREAPFEWLDCEGLERRHQIGRGSLIVLDVPGHGTYEERAGWIDQYWPECPGPWFTREHHVYRPNRIRMSDAAHAWEALQLQNARTQVEFYEGLVAKKADSRYPIQLRSSREEFPFWVKHRWAY
jgi:hypothetical protein